MDGASTDGTVEILQQTPGIIWESVPDKGLYDAINKGIQRATGDIIGLVNSDDILLPGALQVVADAFTANPDIDSVCGNAAFSRWDNINQTWQIFEILQSNRLKQLDWQIGLNGPLIINARFFRRSWFIQNGFFDTRYRIAADREFMLRSMLNCMKTRSIDQPICKYREHAGSLTINQTAGNNLKIRLEDRHVALQFLNDSRLSKSQHNLTQQFVSKQMAVLIWLQLRQGCLLKAFEFALNGFKCLPFWPYHCICALLQRGRNWT